MLNLRHLAWRATVAAAAAAALAGCAATQQAGSGAAAPGGALAPTLQSVDEAALGGVGETVAVAPGDVALVAVLAPTGDERAGIRALAGSLVESARLAEVGIGDPSLRVQLYDTGGTPDGARRAAEAAVAEGAALIVGPLFSQSVAAVAPIAEGAGVPVLAFSTNPAVAGGPVYLVGFLIEGEVERIVGFAAQQGLQHMSAVAPQTPAGELALRALAETAPIAGVRIAATQTYVQSIEGIDSASEQYAAFHLSQADDDPVQAILIPDEGQALQSVAAYLAYYDVSPASTRFLGTGVWSDEITLREIALRGGWFAAPDPSVRAQFAERFEAATGTAPHPLASLGYDAVAAAGAMLADARASGDQYPFSVDAITDPAGFVGVNGVFRFMEDGLNERGLAILEVSAGEFRVIDPAPTRFSDAQAGF